MKARWQGRVIAESDATRVIEGNHYFPPASLVQEHLRSSDQTSFCGWKGKASYYDVVVGDQVNPGAAWTYPDPMKAAAEIRDYVAFWRGVEISED
jgi:uncharacterized protein (DUF427 family)